MESKDSISEKRCSSCYRLNNKPRILLILINDNVIIQNNNFIARGDEGGMLPYLKPKLSIEDNLLTIFYQYTRSNQSYTFKFFNKKMPIIKAESNNIHASSGNFERNTFDFNIGTIITSKGNISEEKDITEKLKMNIKPKMLSDFGPMYEWEVHKNKFL